LQATSPLVYCFRQIGSQFSLRREILAQICHIREEKVALAIDTAVRGAQQGVDGLK
jgi:hypothetical protein